MTGQSTPGKTSHISFFRLALKVLVLLGIFNLAMLPFSSLDGLGRLSAYNRTFPGRLRLPYADNPTRAYNLSLYNLEAMFASHELAAGQKPDNEFRVLVIGDSSTWGFLLPADQTLAAQINQAGLQTADGRHVRVYNLGYPVMSLSKDLLILSQAMRFQPDLIIWPVTLESFPYDKQLFPPLLQNNPEQMRRLIADFSLKLDPNDPNFVQAGFFERTLFGQRRAIADLVRLQLYGVLWAATGIDQDIPETFTPRQEDLEADASFHDLQPPKLQEEDLAFDVLEAGLTLAGNTPVLIVNEPMFVSQGENSDLRYNFFYPRWAYDDFRSLMETKSRELGWNYHDLWDAVDNREFTNSAVHLTARGTAQLAERISKLITDSANP
jgi:hypothetical protein